MTTENYFKPAQRHKLPLKLAVYGPSKSGKTFTALKLMRGIVGPEGKIALIDCENRASEEYQGDPEVGNFDIVAMRDNFAPERYARVMADAVTFGYDGLVVDGISPAWDGPGGVQAIADANTQGQNKFSGWQVATPEHAKLLRAIIDFPRHLICTMRSKTEFVVENGKPRKIGLKPVQRDGIEYEFRLLGEMDIDNNMKIAGRRNFQNRIIPMPGQELAKELLHYLGSEEAAKDDVHAAREAQDRAAEGQAAPADPDAGSAWEPRPPTATTAPPQAGTTQPATPATDSAPAPADAGNVMMTNPGGDVVTVPAVSVTALQAAGWTLATPQSSPVTPVVPSADIAPATETPAPAAPPESASGTTVTGPTEPSSQATPETTPSTATNGDAKMESGQLQKIVELCQELAVIKPDKGDASWWMDWANRKAVEEYHQDFGTMTRDQASGLIERIEKTKLALKES